MNRRIILWLLNQTPILLFVVVFLVIGSLSERFLDLQNLLNILIQSSSIGIAAVGMTFVLLTAGVDLSVGSFMFVAVAVTGKMVFSGQSIALSFACGIIVGIAGGCVNAFVITRLRVIAFIATLAMLFVGRGFGLWITNTRAMNMPEEITELGAARILGIPIPVIALMAVALLSHWF